MNSSYCYLITLPDHTSNAVPPMVISKARKGCPSIINLIEVITVVKVISTNTNVISLALRVA